VKIYIERFKTAEELDDSIFEVLLPTEVVSEVKNGKKSPRSASSTRATSSSRCASSRRTGS
jgi:transcription antitermination factor NusG